MIDFAFSDEQRALAATAREVFAKESPPARLRAVWEGKEPEPGVWRRFADVGLTGIAIASEHGGLGGDEIDLALVLEEIGYAALPEPLAEACVAGLVLSDPDDARALAAGDLLAVVTDEPFVPDADRAGIVVIEGAAHRHFDTERVASVDHGRRLFRVRTHGHGAPLTDSGERAVWARACVLNGISRRLLDDTVAYARDRKQFGVPIGTFQAVKHPLASAHVRLVAARTAAHAAAYVLARGLPAAERAVSTALVEAIAAQAMINRDALQIHAGIGFTFEHDLQMWLKRGLALSFGADAHRARLAEAIFEERSDA